MTIICMTGVFYFLTSPFRTKEERRPDIRVFDLRVVTLHRASFGGNSSLSAYGLSEEQAIRRLEEIRRRSKFHPADLLNVFF